MLSHHHYLADQRNKEDIASVGKGNELKVGIGLNLWSNTIKYCVAFFGQAHMVRLGGKKKAC